MALSAEKSSFRDPAGYVFREDGVFKRAITPRGAEDYNLFITSGLYGDLVERSLIISHREDEAPLPDAQLYKVLVPEQISYISYIYEWSFAQLKDAALLTLEIQKAALRRGMSLKDASAYNIQFRGPEPVFIDTLSFEKKPPGPWVAYGQFCSHFLAPLALMAKLSLTFNQLLRSWLDGIPLDAASSLLPVSTYTNLGLLLHIHAHARSVRKYATARRPASSKPTQVSRDHSAEIVDSLIGAVKSLSPPKQKTEWIEYYGQASHYSEAAESFKTEYVSRIVDQVRPQLVYDLGGNVGVYSRLITRQGIDCVCFDIDPLCVNENYKTSKANRDRHMLPLVMDLTNPSPALGFGLTERLSLLERSKPDFAMALALVHHLRITGNIPFASMARFFSELTPNLLIEWVPIEDAMAQSIIGNRTDYPDYSWDAFLDAFEREFTLEQSGPIPDTVRTLCHFRRRT